MLLSSHSRQRSRGQLPSRSFPVEHRLPTRPAAVSREGSGTPGGLSMLQRSGEYCPRLQLLRGIGCRDGRLEKQAWQCDLRPRGADAPC